MNYLLIDAGNSRIKWLFGSCVPGIVEAVSYKDQWQKKLYRAWHLLPEPDLIGFSNVNTKEITTAVTNLANRLWQKPIKIFTSQKNTDNNLTVIYEQPEKLGADRYLAMLGGRSLTKDALCVVGCGTAITLDAVNNQGQHLGGLILPGIRLAENALIQNTQQLTPMRWSAQKLGKDTASCIGAGIHHAIPAGIDSIINDLENQYGIYFKRFAFGGDAMILFGNHPTYRIEPDLLFAGMIDYFSNH